MPRIKSVIKYFFFKPLCLQEIKLESVNKSRVVAHSSSFEKKISALLSLLIFV